MFGRLFGRRRHDDETAGSGPPELGGETKPADAGSPPPAPLRGQGESFEAYFRRLAGHYLSAEDARTWLALLRPAAQLVPAAGETVVARLGGDPRFAVEVPWPAWEGHGPLAFVAEVDLAALAASGVDPGVQLPDRGRLLAFYFDGSYDNFEGIVGTWDPESLAGARLLYLTDAADVCPVRAAPEGVLVYKERQLTTRQVVTAPGFEHPDLQAAFPEASADLRAWLDHPVNNEAFVEAVYEAAGPYPKHQVGGYADPVQGPVEFEVATGRVPDREDPRYRNEASRWVSLLQVETDDDMMWGDAGTLYWLAKREDLTAGRLDDPGFTWQCS